MSINRLGLKEHRGVQRDYQAEHQVARDSPGCIRWDEQARWVDLWTRLGNEKAEELRDPNNVFYRGLSFNVEEQMAVRNETIAMHFALQGKHLRAIPLLEDAVQKYETALPTDDTKLLSAQCSLADSYVAGEVKLDRAIVMLEHIIEVRRASLTGTDSKVLFPVCNLARAYLNFEQRKKGGLERAIGLLEQHVGEQIESLEEWYLEARNTLVDAYVMSGQIGKALQIGDPLVAALRSAGRTQLAEVLQGDFDDYRSRC